MAALFSGQLLLQGGLAVIQQQVFVVTEVPVAAVFGDEGMGGGASVSSVTKTTISCPSAKAASMKSKAASSAAEAVSCALSRSSARVWNWVRSSSKASLVPTALAWRSSASHLRRAAQTVSRVAAASRLNSPASRWRFVSAS